MLLCKFCRIEKKNDNSLRNHERLCKSNPDKQLTFFQTNQDKVRDSKKSTGTNKFDKARKQGLPIPEVSSDTKKKLSDIAKLRTDEWHKANGIKKSITINLKVKAGTWHTSLAKHMHIDYNGIDLHGSWELKYAQYLDANNIKWIRNKDSFTYFYNEKERRYTPDFYLIDSDEYVEVKGYKTEKDEAKWSQFPKHRKLTILMFEQLKDLEIL